MHSMTIAIWINSGHIQNNSVLVMIYGTRGKTHILYVNKMTRHKGCTLCWSLRVKM
jgi:hypothetical protein